VEEIIEPQIPLEELWGKLYTSEASEIRKKPAKKP